MAEAVTVMSAAGVGVALVLVLGFGVGDALVLVLGFGVGDALVLVLVLGFGVALEELAGLVALGELAAGVALEELGAGVALEELAAGVALEELAAGVAVELPVPDADGVAVADGEVAAKAVPVIPLVMTKRPVAKPTVTGRECADRMRTPCLSWLLQLEHALSGTLGHWGGSTSLCVTDAPIRHQYRRSMPPQRHTSRPNHFHLIAQRHILMCRPGVVTRPNNATVSLPRSVPVYAHLSGRKPVGPGLGARLRVIGPALRGGWPGAQTSGSGSGAGLAAASHTGWWLAVGYGALIGALGLLITTRWVIQHAKETIH